MIATTSQTESQPVMRIRNLITGASLACLFAAAFCVAAQPAAEKLVRPTPQQAAWHDCEIGMFVCLDPCTWQDREYDNQSMPLEKINPEKLDTDQWVSAAEAMGAKYIVFVAKHTGGFCWWQTETTDYGVRNIPWRGGKGDVMKDLAESCRKRGIKLGVYLSPADDQFGAGGGGRCKTPEAQERYNKVFREQLTELLSRYGVMFEIWFDGSSITDVGDILKQYCPKAMVFQGPYATIRWVGNEDGVAPYPNWNSLPLARAKSGVSTGTDGHPDGDAWMPNECDARIRSTWFWNSQNANTLKSVDQLMSMYYQSVGRGGVLLLNIAPDTTGLMPEADVRRAAEFGAEIRRRFGKSIAETSGKGELVELDLGHPARIDHIITLENILEGERVQEYAIEGLVSGQWQELGRGTSIGHKKIDQFAPTEVSQVRLRVVKSSVEPQIRKLAAYRVAGVEVRLLKDYDPAGGKVPFYTEPQTDWKRLRLEDFQLDGVRVRIIAPEKALPGKPWLLERGAGEPLQVARALLEKGVYYIGMDADDFGSPQAVARWNALYAELTEKRGFSKKAVLEGYSRSGLGVYNWATENPEKVACIYLDAPVLSIQSWPGGKGKGSGWPDGWKELQRIYGFKSEAEALAYDRNPVDKAPILAKANVPIIHVCGDSDKAVPYEENTGLFRDRYEKAGGRNMTIILKGGTGHWTHGLKDPTPVVDFVVRAIQESAAPTPPTIDDARKIWEWSSETVGSEWRTVDLALTAFCKDACVYQIDFNAAGGRPLEIQSLQYVFDGTVLPEFIHKVAPDAARYYLTVTGLGKSLALRAVVRVSGEKKDSQGTVTLRKRPLAEAPLNYRVAAPGLSVMLDEQGRIAGCSVVKVTGQTWLDGCQTVGPVAVKSLDGGGYVFTRKLTDAQNHQATLTERFTPTKDSVRWEVQIISDDQPWTTAISTRLNYPATDESRFWTSWGDPDDKTGVWQDPLVWRPFADRSWSYQFSHFMQVMDAQATGKVAPWICIPLATMAEPNVDTALTLVQSPEDTLLDLKLAVTKQGAIALAKTQYRLGEGRTVRFAMDLVAHPADCRSGLGWMVKRYPAYFDPPNPAADAQARWTRAPDESTPGKPAWTSYQTLNDYSRWMRTNGFHVLNYFNVTEYGRNMQFPPPPRQAKNDADLWKDPHDYLFQSDRRSAVMMKGDQPLRSNCYGALIVDPGDPAYQQHLLEQARRHIAHLPDSSGICIDRTDWLGSYNPNADDGVSWVDGRPARSLFVSWKDLMSKLGPLMHEAGKVIFVNNCTVRLETLRHVDGIYSEWAADYWKAQYYINYSALQGLRQFTICESECQ